MAWERRETTGHGASGSGGAAVTGKAARVEGHGITEAPHPPAEQSATNDGNRHGGADGSGHRG
jgi:hypothetical protein